MQPDAPRNEYSGTNGAASLVVPVALGLREVTRLLGELEGLAPNVRVVVLRGSSTGFCRGMDLAEISAEFATEVSRPWEQATNVFAKVLEVLRTSRAITIGVVEGPAQGGGVGLVAACDFVVATEAATFALPELLLGLAPAMILPLLRDRLGLHQAKRWAMTQATWTANEARAAGLVDQVTSVERLEKDLRRLARGLLRNHPRGVAAVKGLAREIDGMPTSLAIERGQAQLNDLLGQEAVRRDLIGFRDFGVLPSEDGT